MREREKVITVVGEWVEKAENDLKLARRVRTAVRRLLPKKTLRRISR